MTFSPADWLVLICYIALILFIGFFIAGRKERKADKHNKGNQDSSAEEFLLAGRKVTLPFFVATLVATWYGNILGVGEFVFSEGLVAWVCFGLPYYIAASLFAWFIAGKIRESNVLTIPEQISLKYGTKAAWISSLIVLIITIPAAYILMLGVLINLFVDIDLWLAIIIGAAISLAYLYTGGFKADILTNAVQFILMFIGFGVLIFFSIQHYGPIGDMLAELPQKHTDFFGDLPWQYILSWFIISLQTFVDPSFHQRCSAAKTPSVARNGIFVSILFWAIFDMLTLMAGLYAKAYVPIADPLMAFPALGELVLPIFWKGVFVTALLATVMSTLDSYAFLSAATIGNDIIKPLILLKNKTLKNKSLNKNIIEKDIIRISTKRLTKIGLLITGIVGVIMAIALPSAIDLIYKTSSIAIPGLLIPLLSGFSDRRLLTNLQAIVIMIASSAVSGLWTILTSLSKSGVLAGAEFITFFEPMIPGIIVSLVLFLTFYFKNNKSNLLL